LCHSSFGKNMMEIQSCSVTPRLLSWLLQRPAYTTNSQVICWIHFIVKPNKNWIEFNIHENSSSHFYATWLHSEFWLEHSLQ
jgi:hypothetical protein